MVATDPTTTADKSFPPETLLKKRKSAQLQRTLKLQEAAERKPASKEKRKVTFERAEKYIKEYRDAEREDNRLKRAANCEDEIEIPSKPKLVFVIRVKGINKIAPKPRKVLQLLRLLQVDNGVFIRLTKATAELLKIVEPYIAFGYPNLASVRKLVYKRGYGKVNKQRVALTDNQIIENALGAHGIICLEDLIHEIYTVGPHFKEASNFLWPFKLSSPTGGWGVRHKIHKFVEAEGLASREENINALIDAQN